MANRASNARANYITTPSSQKDAVARIFRSVFGKRGCNIEEVECEGFGTEGAMQDLVEENMDVVFPGYKVIAHEFPLDGKRIDTLAFDTKSRSFVIIEYKNASSKGGLEQATEYLTLLKQRSSDVMLKYINVTKKQLEKTDVGWDESRMIVIAPSFTSAQCNQVPVLTVPVELHKITKYKNGIMAIECVANNKPKKPTRQPQVPKEDEYLAKNSSPTTRKIYTKLKSALYQRIPDAKIEITQVYIKCVSGGKPVCTVQVAKKSLNLCYTTNSLNITKSDANFVTYLIKDDGKSIGKLGLGDYRSKIKNDKDVARAIPYVEAVYKSKVKRYKK